MKQVYSFLFLSAIVMANDMNLTELLHAGTNKFTANMFSEVAKVNSGSSLVLSAYSVMSPLTLLALASVGASHDELLNSMGLPNDDFAKAIFSMVNTKLNMIQGVDLNAANKVYIPLEYELNPEFAAESQKFFHTEVANVNFTESATTANKINAWVENHTNHHIKNLVSSSDLGPATQAVLVNAWYFKGLWMKPFDRALTSDNDFYVTKDKVVKLPTMYNKNLYKYGESELLKSKILEVPYSGKETSMLIVLPDDVDGIECLLEKLNDLSVLDRETKNLHNVYVHISIPKFKINTTTNLLQILKAMNIKKLFSPSEAKLDKLLKTATNLCISDIIQKAFIEVTEEGTESTVSNVFRGFGSSSIPSEEYKFVANHPFMFFLKEHNNVLFNGVYYG